MAAMGRASGTSGGGCMRPAPDVGAAARAITRIGRIIAWRVTLVSPAATDRPFAQPASWCVFLRRSRTHAEAAATLAQGGPGPPPLGQVAAGDGMARNRDA